MTNNERRDADLVQRFSPVARFAHWAHAVCFVILALTGFSLFYPWLGPLSAPFGGPYPATWFHRWAGAGFIILPLISLVMGRGAFRTWMRDITSWEADDSRFLRLFYREFLGLSYTMPAQGRFNAGQKVNAWVVVVTGVVLALTGLIMWFPNGLALGLVRWSRLVHDLAACLLLAAVISHVYLALLHPRTKAAFQGMWKGTLPRAYLRENHAKWLEGMEKAPE